MVKMTALIEHDLNPFTSVIDEQVTARRSWRETRKRQKWRCCRLKRKKELTMASTEPRFRCILTNDPEKEPSDENSLWLDQEEGKKSAFILPLDEASPLPHVAKPSHLLLQVDNKDTFLFGGIEIVTNARNIEIYLTGEDGKETYLTTSRGLIVTDSNDADTYRFKCLVVCPGGPRPVTRVHFKLLSLKPASCTGATLYLLKLKGRLPPSTAQQQSTEAQATDDAATDSTTRQAAPQPSASVAPSSSPALTQADMGQAMMGVSLLVRSVETSLLESVQSSLDKMERKFDARFNRLEYMLLQQQQQALEQKQTQQEQLNTLKNDFMMQLKEQHSETVELLGSLHGQLAAQQEESSRERIKEVPAVMSDEASDGAEELKASSCEEGTGQVEIPVESTKERADGSDHTGDAASEAKVPDVDLNQSKDEDAGNGAEEGAQSETQQHESVDDQESSQPDVDESNKVVVEAHHENVSESRGIAEADDIDPGEKSIYTEKESTTLDQYGQEGNSDEDVGAKSSAVEPTDEASAPIETQTESSDTTNEDEEAVTSSPLPEKRPVMESRNDAVEIPDLLSSELPPATEPSPTENENKDNPD